MPRHSPTLALTGVLALALLTSCAAADLPQEAPDPSGPADDHGEIAGATEVAEPPSALLSIDGDGRVALLDLLDGTATDLGRTAAPAALATDGRFGFVTTARGLEVVDSGRWSWDHGDHFHFYRAAPRIVGALPGSGAATVTTGMLSTRGGTGVLFADSREAVLVDNSALADGEIVETFRVEVSADTALVAPLHDGAVLATGDQVVFHDSSGEPTGQAAACIDAAGAIVTRVGLAVGCADGAVVVRWQDGAAVFDRVAYPADVEAPRATSFDGRKGRPTVAAPAGADGFWLLDTRRLTWRLVATDVPLVRVVAVDDDEDHVVGLDAEGRIRVFADGTQVAVTEPLIAAVDGSATLTVDAQRAYLTVPEGGVVLEIDYADGGRVARTLPTPTVPLFATEVGR